MAVDTIWKATSAQPVNTAAAWSSGVPLASEVALFPSGGTFDATGASMSTTKVAEIIVDRGFSGVIGSTGTTWTISATLVRFYGSGGFYMTDGTNTTDMVIIDAASPSTPVQLDGSFFTRVIVMRGNVTINGTVTNLSVGSHSGGNADATVTINSGGVVTNVYQQSGTVMSSSTSGHTIWNVNGGTATRNAGGAITNMRIGQGGSMLYRSTSTIAAAELQPGGLLDASQLNDGLTITELVEWPGSTFRGTKASGILTLTNEWDLRDETS